MTRRGEANVSVLFLLACRWVPLSRMAGASWVTFAFSLPSACWSNVWIGIDSPTSTWFRLCSVWVVSHISTVRPSSFLWQTTLTFDRERACSGRCRASSGGDYSYPPLINTAESSVVPRSSSRKCPHPNLLYFPSAADCNSTPKSKRPKCK